MGGKFIMDKVVYYNYKEVLNRIEQFMESSHIRKYCTDICKGDCCNGCYESNKACHKNEGRRLACSCFLCAQLITFVFPTGKERYKYNKLSEAIRNALRKADDRWQYHNVYFEPYTSKQMENFRIRKSLFDQYLPTKTDTKKIANIMCNLIELGHLILRSKIRENEKRKKTKGRKRLC